MQPEQDDIVHAKTKDGFDLPVIDVTHPRFAVPDDPASLHSLQEALLRSEWQRRLMPKFLMRLILKSASKKSRLVGALFGSNAAYLDGISTYAMKLGAGNLVAPYDTPIDRRLASSPHTTFLRLRTQQMAVLIADGLVEALKEDASPLHLVNIGGGPAIDSINALVLLTRSHRPLLDRPIIIHVLDKEEAGAFFGSNALAALKEPGHRLAGIDVELQRHPYDWNEPGPLTSLIDQLATDDAVIAASSEGGLFEYGSDTAIVENLKALDAGGRGVRFAAGSVTRGEAIRRRMIADSGFKLIPRGLGGFAPLAAKARFSIVEGRAGALSDQVLLRPLSRSGNAAAR